MKKVFTLLGLMALFFGNQLVAQDNPCGVEGIVVEASNFQYAPADLEIEAGQTVVWVNVGGTHDVNGLTSTLGENWTNPETFYIGSVTGNMSGVCLGSHTFTVEGTYDYDCSIGQHAANGMVATITVNPAQVSNTVADVVANSDDHTLLEAALGATGLDAALTGEGPFTLFAPDDAAITTLMGVLDITADELLAFDGLTSILQKHVVGAEAYAADLSDGQMIETLLGEDVTVSIVADAVFIDNAQVTVADIPADNGVVHVINAVLLPSAPQTTTVVDIIANSDDHTLLEAAVGAAGLVDALSGEGPFTVFAPTDAAVVALTEALEITADELLALPNLGDILQYHVVGAEAYAADLSDGQMIETLIGEDVTVSITADGVFINNAQVVVADLAADNGVVHVIDAVLLPPTPETTTVVDIIVNSEDHTLLEAAVGAAGLVDALSGEGPFTVFAPTDAAVVALTEALEITADELLALPNLGDILQYHVVGAEAYAADLSDGQMIETLIGEDVTVSITADGVFINNAQVVVADLAADNGVVHVIDAVLLPPTPETTTVVDIIVNSEDHTLLEAAVGAAGLVDALSAEGPFTVFAPTDDAFTALTEALDVTVDELLAYPLLPAVLQYHVVGAEAYSTDLSDGQEIETLLGEDVTVSITADGVFINNAQVIVADLAADNGVVHVIDAVLLPELEEETTVVDIIVESEDHTLLEAAVGAAGLVDALSGEGPFTVFAPTDAAIVALTEALEITADDLLALPNLADILQYHVVGAEAFAADLTDGQLIETLQGSNVTVSITADGVFINDAQVTVADLEADNGVVHVIDAVLLPPTTSVAELASFELNVFPNPVAGGVFNMTGDWEAGASIEIFELTGRKVFETTTTQNTVSVSTEGWAAGTYAVRVADGSSTATQVFLVD